MDAVSGSRTRAHEWRRSAARSGTPFDQRGSCRRAKRTRIRSDEATHLVAREGVGRPFLSKLARPSKSAKTILSSEVDMAYAGSRDCGSPALQMVRWVG